MLQGVLWLNPRTILKQSENYQCEEHKKPFYLDFCVEYILYICLILLKIMIMKKLFLPLAIAAVMSSACSPLFYQQIATLHSENVNLKDDGTFAYEDGVMTIEYDFWAESGKFKFVVTNHSDENIYLNLVGSVDKTAPKSVHLCSFPVVDESAIDLDLEKNMDNIL